MAGCGPINCTPEICTWKPERLVLSKCDCVKASKCIGVADGQEIQMGDLVKLDAGKLAKWVFGTDAVADLKGVSYGYADTTTPDPKCPATLCYFYRDAHLDCAGMNWQGMTNLEAAEVIEHLDSLRIAVHENLGV